MRRRLVVERGVVGHLLHGDDHDLLVSGFCEGFECRGQLVGRQNRVGLRAVEQGLDGGDVSLRIELRGKRGEERRNRAEPHRSEEAGHEIFSVREDHEDDVTRDDTLAG